MIEAILALVSFAVLLLVGVAVEVALFLRVRQRDLEQMLLAIEAEARATRRAITGLVGAVDAYAALDRTAVLERLKAIRRDGDLS